MTTLREAAHRVWDESESKDGAAAVPFDAMNDLHRALATPPSEEATDLETAVSDALAATTMGTDYAEAPEPSDEPGSPYVLRLSNELRARGVRPPPPSEEATGLREALDEYDIHSADDLEMAIAAWKAASDGGRE